MDVELLSRLRTGDEEAFVMLVDRYQQPMLRLARSVVPSHAVAEEAVQDTWMGVVRGIDRFEGRSSLRTWLFRILSSTGPGRPDRGSNPTAPSKRCTPSTRSLRRQRPVGRPARAVDRRQRRRLDAAAVVPVLAAALDDLPPRQRQVVILRDVEGLSSEEACAVLGISLGNQRILLHRGRSRLRGILESEMGRD